MQYKFKNGATVEGTTEQILAIAKSLGETVNLRALGLTARGFYESSTKGTLKISEMEAGHIRNALLKQSREYFETLATESKTLSNEEFSKKYVGLGDNTVVIDLFTELQKRK